MNAWKIFWEICLVVAGSTFAGITVIVAVRGFADLREMFASLAQQKKSNASGNTADHFLRRDPGMFIKHADCLQLGSRLQLKRRRQLVT